MLWPKEGETRGKPIFTDIEEALGLIGESKEEIYAF